MFVPSLYDNSFKSPPCRVIEDVLMECIQIEALRYNLPNSSSSPCPYPILFGVGMASSTPFSNTIYLVILKKETILENVIPSWLILYHIRLKYCKN